MILLHIAEEYGFANEVEIIQPNQAYQGVNLSKTYPICGPKQVQLHTNR